MSGNTLQALRLHQAIEAVCPIVGVSITADNVGTIDYDPSATAAQVAAAKSALAAFDWSDTAYSAWLTQQQRQQATGNVGTATAGLDTPEYVVMRAIVELLVDQLNVLRAAVSPPLAAITYAQAKTAIANKINAGSADS